jgi:hypothetical protein
MESQDRFEEQSPKFPGQKIVLGSLGVSVDVNEALLKTYFSREALTLLLMTTTDLCPAIPSAPACRAL